MKWPAEAIWEAVAPLLPGFTVEILPELDSTNSELMRRSRDGRSEPVLLVAQRQTAGRGRLGRGWQSAAGDSLTFSLGVPLGAGGLVRPVAGGRGQRGRGPASRDPAEVAQRPVAG
jgi:BirA family biotin operon repressor/biotin-[acetyl-CoA-carboxylase] ligase